MKHRQQIILLLLFILLSSAVLVLAIPDSVFGQMTIPTRTPTPNPDNPTDPPPQPTDDNNNTPSPTDPPPAQSSSTPSTNPTNTPVAPGSTPGATNTTQPPGAATSTATATRAGAVGTATGTISASATSIGNEIAPGTTPISFPVVATAFPTAQPCGLPPTFTTTIRAAVYSGPGNDYELIDTLAADETRPIVGRAIYSSWWLIQLDGKFNQAWINNKRGIAHGNTNHIPEIQAPEIDGVTPTPGIQWEPTPVHDCDLTPTVTSTSTVEAVVSGTINDDSEGSSQENDPAAGLDTTTDQRNMLAMTAVPLDLPTAAPTPSLLPIAGLVLIIAAVFVALFFRRNPGSSEPSS